MIQAAIIGCGVIGPVHAASIRYDAEATIRWACDLNHARIQRIQAQRTTTDAAEVLADPEVDLVCVCTQHPAHTDLVVAALAAGKHVLCEKPLASRPSDVDRIVAAAAARPGLVASGVFQHRFTPLARRLRELVMQGAFGDLRSVAIRFACTRSEDYYGADSWRGRWDAEGGGVAINQAIHTLDLGLWISGREPRRVSARAARRRMPTVEVEDLLTAEIALDGGATATFSADNDGVTPWLQSVELTGSRGRVLLGDAYRLQAVEHASAALRAELKAFDSANLDAIALDGAKPAYGCNHVFQLADVLESIRSGRRPMVTVADAATANAVVLASYHSAATGVPVSLPFSPTVYQQPRLQLGKDPSA